MAKAGYKMPEEFLENLAKLGSQFDEIVPEVLAAGAEPVLEKFKSNLSSSIGRDTKYESKSTGELIESVGVTPAMQDDNGDWDVRVGIGDSKDSKGVSNALKASVLEYGKSGQKPKPWLKPAKRSSRKKCINAMKEKFEDRINNI